jgi:hypothetical protein
MNYRICYRQGPQHENGPAASFAAGPFRAPGAARVRGAPGAPPPGRLPPGPARTPSRGARASPRRSRGPGGSHRSCLRAYLSGSGDGVSGAVARGDRVRHRRRTRSTSAGPVPSLYGAGARGRAACAAPAGTWCGDGARAAGGRRDEHQTVASRAPSLQASPAAVHATTALLVQAGKAMSTGPEPRRRRATPQRARCSAPAAAAPRRLAPTNAPRPRRAGRGGGTPRLASARCSRRSSARPGGASGRAS